jgi:hypothetical protein
MWIHGSSDDVLSAIARALELADPLDDPPHRLRMLATRHLFLTRVADFRGALTAAKEWHAAAIQVNDVSCLAISELMQGAAWHFLGDQAAANRHFEAGFVRAGERNLQLCGNDHRVRGLVTMSRALWLSGFPERALATARQATGTAMKSGKPLDTCFALIFTMPVYLWCGDWDAAQDILDQLVSHTHWHLLKPLHAVANAMQGALLIGRGQVERGMAVLTGVLQQMRDHGVDAVRTFVACSIADGLTVAGRPEEALTVIRAARRNAVSGADTVQLPELLRVQANALLSIAPTHEARAERLLVRACRIARRQSAVSWELRAALSLARIRIRQNNREQARHLLSSIYDRFTEGFDTHDLQAAAQLLGELGHTQNARITPMNKRTDWSESSSGLSLSSLGSDRYLTLPSSSQRDDKL